MSTIWKLSFYPSRSNEFHSLVWPTGGWGKITLQRISAPMIHRKKIPTANPMFSRSREFNKASNNIVWCKRKSEIQDGGSQTGILISQPVHNVASRFRRLYLYFEGPGIQWSYFPFCVMQAEIRNPRWRLTKKEILISQPVYNLCIRVAPGETIAH